MCFYLILKQKLYFEMFFVENALTQYQAQENVEKEHLNENLNEIVN